MDLFRRGVNPPPFKNSRSDYLERQIKHEKNIISAPDMWPSHTTSK